MNHRLQLRNYCALSILKFQGIDRCGYSPSECEALGHAFEAIQEPAVSGNEQIQMANA